VNVLDEKLKTPIKPTGGSLGFFWGIHLRELLFFFQRGRKGARLHAFLISISLKMELH